MTEREPTGLDVGEVRLAGEEQLTVQHERLDRGEGGAGGDTERHAVEQVVEPRLCGQPERADLLEHLGDDRHE